MNLTQCWAGEAADWGSLCLKLLQCNAELFSEQLQKLMSCQK